MQNKYVLLTRLFIVCCCEAISTFGIQELPSDGSRKFCSKRAAFPLSQAAAISQVVADALKQPEATALLAKQRLQRQQRKCCICDDDDKDATHVSNRECNMHLCLGSFPIDIRDQCGHEKRSQFERNHCIIMCRICRRYAFEERHVFSFVKDATFAIFRQACVDVVELQAYNKANRNSNQKSQKCTTN
jgi:hypothetical protein